MFAEAVVGRLAGSAITLRESLTPEEQQAARTLIIERYAQLDWKAR
jgi:hypothetical protein